MNAYIATRYYKELTQSVNLTSNTNSLNSFMNKMSVLLILSKNMLQNHKWSFSSPDRRDNCSCTFRSLAYYFVCGQIAMCFSRCDLALAEPLVSLDMKSIKENNRPDQFSSRCKTCSLKTTLETIMHDMTAQSHIQLLTQIKKRVWCSERQFLSHGVGCSPIWELESDYRTCNYICMM